jgi:hypothetical protein
MEKLKKLLAKIMFWKQPENVTALRKEPPREYLDPVSTPLAEIKETHDAWTRGEIKPRVLARPHQPRKWA